MAEVLIAGGYDHHNHPFLYHLLSAGIDISGARTTKEAIKLVAESVDSFTGEAILVTGWNNSRYELSQRDVETFSRPAVVFNASFHGAVINTAAEKYLAFPAGTPGVQSNGIIIEQAIFTTLDRLALSVKENKTGLLTQQKDLFSKGIVAVDDMFVNSVEQVQAYAELVAEKRLKLKMSLWFRPKLIEQLSTMGAGGKALLSLAEGVKFVLDGAFGVKTAALNVPYSDDRANYGLLLMSGKELIQAIQSALDLGIKKIAIHCIGDWAISVALNVFDSLAGEGVDTSGWRLEHAELINSSYALFAKELGLILSMQPNFRSDCEDYQDRLGKTRVSWINPFRMLIDLAGFVPGEDLLLGSDGMPTGLLHGLQTAVNGFTSAQSMSRKEALAGYTSKDTNDYVVLCGDPFDPSTEILSTCVNKEVVYKDP